MSIVVIVSLCITCLAMFIAGYVWYSAKKELRIRLKTDLDAIKKREHDRKIDIERGCRDVKKIINDGDSKSLSDYLDGFSDRMRSRQKKLDNGKH